MNLIWITRERNRNFIFSDDLFLNLILIEPNIPFEKTRFKSLKSQMCIVRLSQDRAVAAMVDLVAMMAVTTPMEVVNMTV